MTPITVGTATAKPGKIATGWLDGVELPTGGSDRFPVIIAQGKQDGPVFWVTASIHGGEHTGLIVAQELVTPALVSQLSGTLVVMPTLNPAGLRIKQREPYYHNGDPNRLFPEPEALRDRDGGGLLGLAAAYQQVYDAVAASGASFLLDLHNAQIGSLPMVFRDPVLYHRRFGRGLAKREAEALQKRLGAMLDVFGFTVINEFVADYYFEKNLHRSVSGSVLNGLCIPAATVELGSWMHVDPNVVAACLAGLRNVLRWAGLLPGEPEPVEGIPVLNSDVPLRRCIHPSAPRAGIVHHLARPGERVEVGQPLARLTDIFGQPAGPDGGLLRSEVEGYVIAWLHGVVRYEGEPIMIMAVPDDSELVLPYPY